MNENLPETLEWLDSRYLEGRKIITDEYIDDKSLNPDFCRTFYADNKPVMLKDLRGERDHFKSHICGISNCYVSLSYFEMQQLLERMIREPWEIQNILPVLQECFLIRIVFAV